MLKKRKSTNNISGVALIEPLICAIRGQKVILDSDLARVYGVTTKRFNEQVKRNKERFPDDFMFRLTSEEANFLRSQFATSNEIGAAESNRSQIATGSQKHRDPRSLPYAFTEHGAIMAANVLRSPLATQMSVFVVRAFIRLRQMIMAHKDLEARLNELEAKVGSLDGDVQESSGLFGS